MVFAQQPYTLRIPRGHEPSSNCVRSLRTGCRGAKKVKVCSPGVGDVRSGRGVRDGVLMTGAAAPAAATARKLMPALGCQLVMNLVISAFASGSI